MSLSTLLDYYPTLLSAVTTGIGSLLIYSEVRCLLNARTMTVIFGIPNPTADESLFLQSATGRNAAAGIFIWIMTYMGERQALGIFLLCWMCAGLSDTKLLLGHPRGERVGLHIQNTVGLLVFGILLIKSA